MHVSRAISVFAIGFMAGVAIFSWLGFSWWLIIAIAIAAVSFGVLEAVDGTEKTLLAFFLFLACLFGFLRASTFSFEPDAKENFFWLESRGYLMEKVNEALPNAEGSVFNAMVFGDEGGVSQELKKAFNVTGTRHILAISGMNISIISLMLLNFGLAVGMWRKHAFWFAVSGIVAFIFLVGSPPSAVRAGIMGILLLWSQNRGRLVESWRPVLVAAFVMVALNPQLLVFDIGFQLSFLAVVGIVYFQNFCGRVFKWIPVKFARELIVLSFAVQIATWPITLYNFGTFSVISPVANVFIVPMLTPIMFLGLGFSIFSWWFFAAKLFLWPAWLILKVTDWLVYFFSSVSWASLNLGKASAILIFLYYPLLVLFWRFLERKGLNESSS